MSDKQPLLLSYYWEKRTKQKLMVIQKPLRPMDHRTATRGTLQGTQQKAPAWALVEEENFNVA